MIINSWWTVVLYKDAQPCNRYAISVPCRVETLRGLASVRWSPPTQLGEVSRAVRHALGAGAVALQAHRIVEGSRLAAPQVV